jgi:lysophospholipase L1-like esterase
MRNTGVLINIFLIVILSVVCIREHYPERLFHRIFDRPQPTERKSYLNNIQWHARENYFDQDTISHYEVVMIGNSITQGGLWEQLLNSTSLKNLGIGSDISEGVLNRIQRAIGYSPRYLFIEIGINDICANIPTDTIIRNYQRIVSLLASHDIITGITGVIYVGESYPNAAEINKAVESFNKELMSLSRDGVYYIDLNSGLAPNGFLSADLTYDQIHLTPKGYSIYAKTINDFMKAHEAHHQ